MGERERDGWDNEMGEWVVGGMKEERWGRGRETYGIMRWGSGW